MIRRFPWLPLSAALLAAAWALPAAAGDADSLIRKAASTRSLGNSIQTIDLVRTERSGQTKQFTLLTHSRVVDGAEQSHALLRAPTELAGIQLLRIGAADGAEAVWMYMPLGDSLNRITGSSRTGPFMGTDFTYEDLALGDPDAGTHEVLGDEAIEVAGQQYDCVKVATTPRAGLETAYGKLITWIDKQAQVPRRIVLFDRDGETETKELTFEQTASAGDRVFPVVMRMRNLKRNTSTLLTVRDYRLDVPAAELPDTLFDPEQLAEHTDL